MTDNYYKITVWLNDQIIFYEFLDAPDEKMLVKYREYTEQCIRELYYKEGNKLKTTVTRVTEELKIVTDDLVKEKQDLLQELSKNKQEKIELLRKVNIIHTKSLPL